MPEVTIKIGGREFLVACQAGEEAFLEGAAAALNTEATSLTSQIGRMPESRMLLMSGLLLADKTAATDEKLKLAETEIAALRAELAKIANAPPRSVQVPVVPQQVLEHLAELSAQAEAVADNLEEKIAT